MLDPDCCSLDGDASEPYARQTAIDPSTTLYFLECGISGYNRFTSIWISQRGGDLKRPVFGEIPAAISNTSSVGLYPGPETDNGWLTTSWYDGETFGVTYCVRHICDAGASLEYSWTGAQLVPARLRSRGDDCCSELEDIGPWPIVWPDSEACRYRWQISGQKIELVSITPTKEKRTVIAGLPGSCSVDQDAEILECGDYYVPVTSRGSDWVVWLSGGTSDEPGPAREIVAVPRGCSL